MSDKDIPDTNLSFRGDISHRGHIHSSAREQYTPAVSSLATGNRCGHDKTNPRLYAWPTAYKPHHFIQGLIERLKKLYFRPGSFLSLSSRKKRTERVEACVAVGQLLVSRCDMETLTVRPMTIEYIADTLNLGYRRTIRALKDLERMGYLVTGIRWVQYQKGVFKSLAAVRCLTRHFFLCLGVTARMLNRLQQSTKARNVLTQATKASQKRFKALLTTQGLSLTQTAQEARQALRRLFQAQAPPKP